jgi:hypothetical protein
MAAQEIVEGNPPNIDAIRAAFDVVFGTVFSYGNYVYNPDGVEVSVPLAAHEDTHRRQQERAGGPERWWHRYIHDRDFRWSQEAEAYAQQYAKYCWMFKDRNARVRYLGSLAREMAAPIYKFATSPAHTREAILAAIK